MRSLLEARSDFPILKRVIHGHPLVFLDNAATTQKPQPVLNALLEFLTHSNANIHRGVYQLSEDASDAYEKARQAVADFVGVKDSRRVVFTRGTTESINLVAQSWLRPRLQAGDRIVLTEMEHHSNQIPWQLVAQERQAELDYVAITDSGELELNHLEQLLAQRPRLLAVTAVSNVLGTINPLETILDLAQRYEVPVVVDAAQAVGRIPLEDWAERCDFLAFSGHKLYGPTGIGVLCGRFDRLDEMSPWQGGGGMIAKVGRHSSSWAAIPARLEAGTPPIAEAVALQAAIEYVQEWGVPKIRQHEQELVAHALNRLAEEPDVTVYGPSQASKRTGVVSFDLEGVHPHDVAQILDETGIAVRAGHHCTQVLHERLGVRATVRLSMALYNTLEEIDSAVSALANVRKVFS
ncbi:MAG: SufS family cysteine desulfurase [Proteobacteria bacterium]|nr:SufS family cysteine desulfurase [Pseudomonadota bacterium]